MYGKLQFIVPVPINSIYLMVDLTIVQIHAITTHIMVTRSTRSRACKSFAILSRGSCKQQINLLGIVICRKFKNAECKKMVDASKRRHKGQ